MDLTLIISSLVSCYIFGYCFGFKFLAFRRIMESSF